VVEQPDLLLGRHWIIWNPNVLQLEKKIENK